MPRKKPQVTIIESWVDAYENATHAILTAIANYGFLSDDGINRYAFHNVAHHKVFDNLIPEMAEKGLIVRLSNGCFQITDKGRGML